MNNEHAARLRELAQEQLDMAKTLTPMYSSGLIAACRADAAALLAGAEALEKSEELRAVVRDFQRMYCGFGMKTEAEALNDRATAALRAARGEK